MAADSNAGIEGDIAYLLVETRPYASRRYSFYKSDTDGGLEVARMLFDTVGHFSYPSQAAQQAAYAADGDAAVAKIVPDIAGVDYETVLQWQAELALHG